MALGGMKNSWFTTIAVALVIGLLTVFLGLQYNWLRQASVAERERMQKRAEIDTKNFADDFNREIQGAYFNFQADPLAIEQGNAAEVAERYDYWKQNAGHPGLIRDLVYISNQPDPNPRRFDPAARTLEKIPIDERFVAIVAKIKNEQNPRPMLEEEFALAVPTLAPEHRVEQMMIRRREPAEGPLLKEPKAVGYFVVFLDDAVVKDQLLPALVAKHFSSKEFEVTVSNLKGENVFQTAPSSATDAAASLFDLTPDNFIFFANREMIPRKTESADADVVVDQRVESTTSSHELKSKTGNTKTFTIEMKDTGTKKRTAVVSSTSAGESPWKLNVQHAAGSIDAFIQNEQNKSMLIGTGVYLLLLGSILAIVISANRAKAFARRQVEFVSSVSHEFRTPLAVIYSAGENLADGVATDNAQVARYGNLIKGEGKKLTGMVEQILEFAGARSGKKKYNIAKCDVAQSVRNAIGDCAPLIEENGFAFEENISDRLPLIDADADSIESAVRNLIHNAVKYGNGSRWLRVSTENGNGTIKVSVEDRGIGIAAADQKKIFEPFYRAKSVVDAQIHGNGLGLSLVKEITEAHGGSVKVSSEAGKGSTFTIELPSEPHA